MNVTISLADLKTPDTITMNETISLTDLKAEVIKAGFAVATAWEDEFMAYAGSVETVPGCYGHPRFEATFCKRTGWFRAGKKSRKMS